MKSRKVVWSAAAVDDLERTAAYISEDSPAAARRVAAAIRACGKRLGAFSSGRAGRVAGTLEKVVPRLPHIIAYTISASESGREQLVILRVIHGARDWPDEAWPK